MTAAEPQDLHWYSQTLAKHLGAGEVGHSPGMPFPITRGSEWPWGISTGGCSCCFLGNHSMCGQGRAQKMSCLEPTHSASCSLADDRLSGSFATTQGGAYSQGLRDKAQGLVSFQNIS